MREPRLDFTTHPRSCACHKCRGVSGVGDIKPGPKVRNTDPDTSRAAWLDNLPRAGTQRHRIYWAIRLTRATLRGVTCSEICAMTGIKWNSASTRISELIKAGYVEDTGERREGPDGSMQRVVRAVVR